MSDFDEKRKGHWHPSKRPSQRELAAAQQQPDVSERSKPDPEPKLVQTVAVPVVEPSPVTESPEETHIPKDEPETLNVPEEPEQAEEEPFQLLTFASSSPPTIPSEPSLASSHDTSSVKNSADQTLEKSLKSIPQPSHDLLPSPVLSKDLDISEPVYQKLPPPPATAEEPEITVATEATIEPLVIVTPIDLKSVDKIAEPKDNHAIPTSPENETLEITSPKEPVKTPVSPVQTSSPHPESSILEAGFVQEDTNTEHASHDFSFELGTEKLNDQDPGNTSTSSFSIIRTVESPKKSIFSSAVESPILDRGAPALSFDDNEAAPLPRTFSKSTTSAESFIDLTEEEDNSVALKEEPTTAPKDNTSEGSAVIDLTSDEEKQASVSQALVAETEVKSTSEQILEVQEHVATDEKTLPAFPEEAVSPPPSALKTADAAELDANPAKKNTLESETSPFDGTSQDDSFFNDIDTGVKEPFDSKITSSDVTVKTEVLDPEQSLPESSGDNDLSQAFTQSGISPITAAATASTSVNSMAPHSPTKDEDNLSNSLFGAPADNDPFSSSLSQSTPSESEPEPKSTEHNPFGASGEDDFLKPLDRSKKHTAKSASVSASSLFGEPDSNSDSFFSSIAKTGDASSKPIAKSTISKEVELVSVREGLSDIFGSEEDDFAKLLAEDLAAKNKGEDSKKPRVDLSQSFAFLDDGDFLPDDYIEPAPTPPVPHTKAAGHQNVAHAQKAQATPSNPYQPQRQQQPHQPQRYKTKEFNTAQNSFDLPAGFCPPVSLQGSHSHHHYQPVAQPQQQPQQQQQFNAQQMPRSPKAVTKKTSSFFEELPIIPPKIIRRNTQTPNPYSPQLLPSQPQHPVPPSITASPVNPYGALQQPPQRPPSTTAPYTHTAASIAQPPHVNQYSPVIGTAQLANQYSPSEQSYAPNQYAPAPPNPYNPSVIARGNTPQQNAGPYNRQLPQGFTAPPANKAAHLYQQEHNQYGSNSPPSAYGGHPSAANNMYRRTSAASPLQRSMSPPQGVTPLNLAHNPYAPNAQGAAGPPKPVSTRLQPEAKFSNQSPKSPTQQRASAYGDMPADIGMRAAESTRSPEVQQAILHAKMMRSPPRPDYGHSINSMISPPLNSSVPNSPPSVRQSLSGGSGYLPSSADLNYGQQNFAPSAPMANPETLLQRQFPLFCWGNSTKAVVAIPPRIAFGGATTTSEIKIVDVAEMLNPDSATKFPTSIVTAKGPVKSRKKELEKWVEEHITWVDHKLSTATREEAVRYVDRSLLWRVVLELLRGDSSASAANPATVNSICKLLDPTIDHSKERADPKQQFAPALDIYNQSQNRQANPADHHDRSLTPNDIKEVMDSLKAGNREAALKYALDQRLWAHALILASSIGSTQWTDTVAEFVRENVRNFPTTSARNMAFMYRIFSGAKEDSVSEILPQNRSIATSLPQPSPELNASLREWKSVVALAFANRSPMYGDAVNSISSLLSQSGFVEAAHICQILFNPSTFGADGNKKPFSLLGTETGQDIDSITLSMVYEYYRCSTDNNGQNYHPHLLPYKLYFTSYLADYGKISEARSLYDNISNILKSSPKNRYITPVFLSQVEALGHRLNIMPEEVATGWFGGKLARPKFDQVLGQIDKSLSKFIAGEEMEAPQKPEQDGGIFKRLAETPSTSSSYVDIRSRYHSAVDPDGTIGLPSRTQSTVGFQLGSTGSIADLGRAMSPTHNFGSAHDDPYRPRSAGPTRASFDNRRPSAATPERVSSPATYNTVLDSRNSIYGPLDNKPVSSGPNSPNRGKIPNVTPPHPPKSASVSLPNPYAPTSKPNLTARKSLYTPYAPRDPDQLTATPRRPSLSSAYNLAEDTRKKSYGNGSPGSADVSSPNSSTGLPLPLPPYASAPHQSYPPRSSAATPEHGSVSSNPSRIQSPVSRIQSPYESVVAPPPPSLSRNKNPYEPSNPSPRSSKSSFSGEHRPAFGHDDFGKPVGTPESHHDVRSSLSGSPFIDDYPQPPAPPPKQETQEYRPPSVQGKPAVAEASPSNPYEHLPEPKKEPAPKKYAPVSSYNPYAPVSTAPVSPTSERHVDPYAPAASSDAKKTGSYSPVKASDNNTTESGVDSYYGGYNPYGYNPYDEGPETSNNNQEGGEASKMEDKPAETTETDATEEKKEDDNEENQEEENDFYAPYEQPDYGYRNDDDFDVPEEVTGDGLDPEAGSGSFFVPLGAPSFAPRAVSEAVPLSHASNKTPSQINTPPPPTAAVEEEDFEDFGIANKPKTEEPKKEEPAAEKQEEKKDDAEKKGWFGWLSRKHDEQPKAIKAKLGEESSFYYDKELKRWINKKAPIDEQTKPNLPPPPPPGESTHSAPKSSSTPTPPVSISPSVTPMPPGPSTPAPPSSATPPIPSTASLTGGIDDLLAAAGTASAGGTRKARRSARNRYVDIMNQ